MTTVKNKSKKKTQDWEKELEKLLKKLDKQKSATTRRTTLQAIHNVRYRKLTTDQRNKLSTTTTTKAKAAEAELRALNRLVSGSVKKSKYQRKYTDEQRQRIKAIREEEKQAKIKAREEAKEQRRIAKETIERIKEDKRKAREELKKKREEERAKKKEFEDLGLKYDKKLGMWVSIEESKAEEYKSIEKDILKDLENIRNKVSKLTDYDLKYASEKSLDEFKANQSTILEDIHDIIQESIDKIDSRYDLLKTIAEYKGIDVENINVLRRAIGGEMNFQETWLINTYMDNGENGKYGDDHLGDTAKNASKIANILQYLSETMETMPQNIVDEYHRYLDRITDITIFRIQYDTYVASSGINEVHSIITNYNENLNEMIQNPSYDIYKQNVDEYTSDWISEQEWEERMREFRS